MKRFTLAFLLLPLFGACGQTSSDPEPEVPCTIALAELPVDDPCAPFSGSTEQHKAACCGQRGCTFFSDVGVCHSWARICTESKDECPVGQRCEFASTGLDGDHCWGGNWIVTLRGLCVPNPRPNLCFDPCATALTRADCCANPGCGWHRAHGLCVSPESLCTGDPAGCGAGKRCEFAKLLAPADMEDDCGTDGPGGGYLPVRGICVPGFDPDPSLDPCLEHRNPSTCCSATGCGWHHSHGLCVSAGRICTDDPEACGPGLECVEAMRPHYEDVTPGSDDCMTPAALTPVSVARHALCLPPSR